MRDQASCIYSLLFCSDCINLAGDDLCSSLKDTCSNDYVNMINNCRKTCTSCDVLPGMSHICLRHVLAWHMSGCNIDPLHTIIIYSSWFQPRAALSLADIIYIYNTCNGSAISESIGSPLLPGSVNDLTLGLIIILSSPFSADGRLAAFSAFFVSLDPVYLQIWRLSSTATSYDLVYIQRVVPYSVNVAQMVGAFNVWVDFWS